MASQETEEEALRILHAEDEFVAAHRVIPPEVRASHALRASMYAEEQEPAESAATVRDPETTIPAPIVTGAAIGLSPSATRWVKANSAAATKLLEWATTLHEPRALKLILPLVALEIAYVKLERSGNALSFFLSSGGPTVGFEFGTDITIEFSGERLSVVSLGSGLSSEGQFPYAKLEFYAHDANLRA